MSISVRRVPFARSRLLVEAAVLALFALVGTAANAGEPTTMPLLRLETGMHTAMIRQIATDDRGRWAVTVSDDKTARVWEIASGRQLNVLRPPQGEGHEGKLFAVAMSPDGAVVAVGGWTGDSWDEGHSIYVFDRVSGALTRRISGLQNIVTALSISRDGRLLATGLGSGGIRLFALASGVLLGKDESYGGQVFGVDFDAQAERLLTTSEDGTVRVHALENRGLHLAASRALDEVSGRFQARFAPDGRRIAVGFSGAIEVKLFDRQINKIRSLDVVGIKNGNLTEVAWSADGKRLIAGQWTQDGSQIVRRWSWKENGYSFEDHAISRRTISKLVALPKDVELGGWIFSSEDPRWGVLSPAGELIRHYDARVVDFREQGSTFGLTKDGCGIQFRYGSKSKATSAFNACSLRLAKKLFEDVFEPRVKAPYLVVKNWKDAPNPKVNGLTLALADDETSRALAVVPGDHRFLLGAEFSLRLFDRKGAQIWGRAAPGVVWAVNVSSDSRLAVAAYGDGTIRWHLLADRGREILAFFPHADRKRWVAWTPEGFFAASPDAEELIGYHLNRGKDHEGEFVSARQLWETFYQPDLIARRLSSEGDALVQEAMKRVGDVRALLSGVEPPELRLESPAEASSDGAYSLKVRVVKSGKGGSRLIVRIDGTELPARPVSPALTPGGLIEIPVQLSPGLRALSAELVDARGIASPAVLANVRVSSPNSGKQPVLHVLAVGVSRYRDQALNSGVAFAAADATAVADALERGAVGVYRKVNKAVLPNDEAKRDLIVATAGKMAESVAPEDSVVLYLAGHGLSTDSDYYFVPQDAKHTNEDALKEQSLGATQLREMLSKFKANKVLVLLDTCSSGAFEMVPGRDAVGDKSAMDRLARLSGRATIAAAADKKMAMEGEGGHGVFTAALLAALTKKGDDNKNGEIDVAELAKYIGEAVPAITKRKWGYEQFPMIRTSGSPFPLVKAANAR